MLAVWRTWTSSTQSMSRLWLGFHLTYVLIFDACCCKMIWSCKFDQLFDRVFYHGILKDPKTSSTAYFNLYIFFSDEDLYFPVVFETQAKSRGHLIVALFSTKTLAYINFLFEHFISKLFLDPVVPSAVIPLRCFLLLSFRFQVVVIINGLYACSLPFILLRCSLTSILVLSFRMLQPPKEMNSKTTFWSVSCSWEYMRRVLKGHLQSRRRVSQLF